MRRLTRLAWLAALVALAVVVLTACGGDGDDGPGSADRLPTRTVEVGEVTVKVTPVRIDRRDAEFKVAFDTHSVELDLDVADAARLTVGGTQWDGPVWDGDGPSGHHREGTLRFAARGDPTGTARLQIDGLADPVTTTWELEGA